MHRMILAAREEVAHKQMLAAAEHLAERFNMTTELQALQAAGQHRKPEIARLEEEEALATFMRRLDATTSLVPRTGQPNAVPVPLAPVSKPAEAIPVPLATKPAEALPAAAEQAASNNGGVPGPVEPEEAQADPEAPAVEPMPPKAAKPKGKPKAG